MIDTTQFMAMSGMNGAQGASGGRPPPPPPPKDEDSVDSLEQGLGSGVIDLETLLARLSETFGTDASGIVSDSGDIDFDSLSEMLADAREAQKQQRDDRLVTDLTDRFGEEAALSVLDENGDIDHETVRALFAQSGDMPPPPPGGAGGQIGGYASAVNQATPFINLLA